MALKQGLTSPEVKKLQTGLNLLGFDCGKADGIFGKKTKDAVEDFQDSVDLYEDGIVGYNTGSAYNAKVAAEFRVSLEIPSQNPTKTTTKLRLVNVRCDKHGDGFSAMDMREDVAVKFRKVREFINSLGGIVTSAGCGRPLSLGGGKSQSDTSFHYFFGAFDLSLGSGMKNADTDPFVIVDDGDGYWRVWARVTSDTIENRTLKAVVAWTKNKKLYTKTVETTGRFVDFTEACKANGFERIRRRKSFTKGLRYTAAEWWHFQYEVGLIVGESTFGEELLKVYDEGTIRKKFRGNWNILKYARFGKEFN